MYCVNNAFIIKVVLNLFVRITIDGDLTVSLILFNYLCLKINRNNIQLPAAQKQPPIQR